MCAHFRMRVLTICTQLFQYDVCKVKKYNCSLAKQWLAICQFIYGGNSTSLLLLLLAAISLPFYYQKNHFFSFFLHAYFTTQPIECTCVRSFSFWSTLWSWVSMQYTLYYAVCIYQGCNLIIVHVALHYKRLVLDK